MEYRRFVNEQEKNVVWSKVWVYYMYVHCSVDCNLTYCNREMV